MSGAEETDVAMPERAVLRDLYTRPGFLLRRAHQISSALFIEETAELGVTTAQFGMLTVLAACAPLDQIGAAKLLRLDRSTTGVVVRNLEERRLIERVLDPEDRRRRVLRITEQGRELLAQLNRLGDASQRRGLSVLDAEEAATLVGLLAKFVQAHER